jgi:glutamate transport system permease protein
VSSRRDTPTKSPRGAAGRHCHSAADQSEPGGTVSALYDVPGPRTRRRVMIGSIIGTLLVAALIALAVHRLADHGVFKHRQWEPFTDPGVQRFLLRGLASTAKAAAVAIVLALAFGVIFAAGRLSEHAWIRIPAVAITEFFRAVPLLLLILFLFLGFDDQLRPLGELVGSEVPGAFGALVVGLMLHNGSVLTETFRAGILAVPRGQSEAAYSLGLRKSQVMRMILVPQAVRIMLPAIISQCVVALKDTALGFVIGYEELLRRGKAVYNEYGNIVPTAIVIAVIYVIINTLLSLLASWLERRLRQRGTRPITLDPAAET